MGGAGEEISNFPAAARRDFIGVRVLAPAQTGERKEREDNLGFIHSVRRMLRLTKINEHIKEHILLKFSALIKLK